MRSLKLTLAACLASHALEAHSIVFKIATMAPKESSWGAALHKLSRKAPEITGGKLRFKIYYGGVSGDETTVMRKIRIGKLHGGVFTGKALGEIYGDVRAMEVPFNFSKNRQKAWQALKVGESFFDQGFKKKGFRNLGFFEIGLVYLVSKEKISSLADLKGKKIWTWSGDLLSQTIVESLNLVGVPLGLESVHTALSTGMIDTVYNSPLGMLALQWHTKINYLVEDPITFSIGALLIRDKAMKMLSEEDRKKITKLAHEIIEEANKDTVKKNEESLVQMKKMGIEFLKFSEKDMKEGVGIRESVIKKLKGKMFSDKAVAFLKKVDKMSDGERAEASAPTAKKSSKDKS